jgi:S-adenosyl-L-methionine hydrolase (adenosine-forming)
MSIVTLTTDFGVRDYYVGALKGVILSIAPDARLIDLTHEIPPQDVLAGAFVLRHAAREFPPDTVHLAVVDPGVGSSRRPLAARGRDQYWVGPDNGLFSFAFDAPDGEVRAIDAPALTGARRSATFHGRDLFAPIAAHLSRGLSLSAVGPLVTDPVQLEELIPQRGDERIEGQILHIDRFGNLVTSIAAADLAGWKDGLRIHLSADRHLNRLCRTYADVPPGELLALIGSADLLEISVNGGSAARHLGLDRRAPIAVERRPSPANPT